MPIQRIGIPVDDLILSKQNIRKNLDDGQEDSRIENLAGSIAKLGLRQALEVRQVSDHQYEIVAGQRRYLACKQLGFDNVECVILEDVDDVDALNISLAENLQRANMHPIDKTNALKTLHDKFKSVSVVAREACLSEATVRKYLNIASLPECIQNQLGAGDGTNSVAMMSRLATTFKGSEAEEVLEKIGPFNGSIKMEIIKRSNGRLDVIDDLVEKAQEGAFDIKRCDQQYGCQIIRSIIAGEISDMEFQAMVESAAMRHAAALPVTNGHNPVHEFWKALSQDTD